MKSNLDDGARGDQPVIRVDLLANVTFMLGIKGVSDQLRLFLRCKPDGEVWVSIRNGKGD